MKLLLKVALFVSFFVFVLLGCVPSQSTKEPIKSKTTLNRDPHILIVTIYGNPIDLDPASNTESLANMILFNTNEGLVRVSSKNIEEFEPQLAEKWESNEDYTTWVFHIRQDAKFHDGTQVDADAIKFSFTRLINSKLAYSFILAQFIDNPDTQIVVKDRFTLQFNFSKPTPLLLKALSSPYGSLIISPTLVKQNEKSGDMAHEWLQTNEAGSGPYMLTEWKPNEQLVLTKFPDWWGWQNSQGNFEKIILKITPERASRRSLVEKGDVDIAFDFGPEDWDALKKNPEVQLELSDALAVQYFVLGNYGALKDPRVRLALSYAFDYNGYINEIWKGYVPRSYSVFPGKLTCYDKNVFRFQTDLKKAKDLLDEAGIDKNLTLRYWTTGDRLETLAGQVMQSQLAKIGVDFKIEQRDVATFVSVAYGDVEWPDRPDVFGWTFWPDYNDPTDFSWYNFHSSAAGSKGGNIGFYANQRVDKLIDNAVDLMDQGALCNSYKEVQEILVKQDPAWIPLVQLPNEAVLRKDIGGYISNPMYHNIFYFQKFFRIGE